VIKWTSIPFKLGGKRNLIAILIPVLVWAVVFIFWGIGWFILAVILVGTSIMPYFFPTSYTLTQDEIFINSFFVKQRKKWKYFKTFYVDNNGIFLSPFNKPRRLENYRGLFIRFHKNKDEVVQFVKKAMEKAFEK